MLKIGVIADDFTGATDIASFLVENGLKTIQITELDENMPCPDVEALVISGKTRSCPADEAVAYSLRACRYLKQNGSKLFFFKYCSTFDSTSNGNIGPVTDALMKELHTDFTILSPALPVNKRTVYKGYLFAGDTLLEESGMKDHPVTPMRDSLIKRLMEAQAEGQCAVIDIDTIRSGKDAVLQALKKAKEQGYKYASADCLDEQDLVLQGETFKDFKLVTGGSGLAIGLARALRDHINGPDVVKAGYPQGKGAVVFSGSCSVMTNRQVEKYRKIASSKCVEVDRLMGDDCNRLNFIRECAEFVKKHLYDEMAPLLFATANPDHLHELQKKYGAEATARAVENFFSQTAVILKDEGVSRFIVAGGETSGIVTKSLKVKGFYIGPSVAPGVPWVRSIDSSVSLILKSGNFGDEDFFEKTQKDYPV